MRDMFSLLSSPDVGEDFPAHSVGVGLTVRLQTLARGDDRHAQAAEDLRKVGGLRVDAKTRLADASAAADRALAVRAVLERDGQRLADLALARLGHGVVGDVAP